MKKFSTYLLVMFMIVFWILRIIITLASQLGKSFMGIVPMNETFEIVILFATLACVVLIAKRKLTGSLLYIVLHAFYKNFRHHFYYFFESPASSAVIKTIS